MNATSESDTCIRSVSLGSVVYMNIKEREVGRSQTVGCCLGLVPERVDQGQRAHVIEAPALLFRELELGGLEVVGQLFVGPRTDYDGGNTRSSEQPREATCAADTPRSSAISTSTSMVS